MMEPETDKGKWYEVRNIEEVNSPSLLVYPDRIENNILKMIDIAGDVRRLRPHVKTHKMPEIIRLQLKHGISKFKCATIAEAEMVAQCGAADVLVAIQPVGPNIERFFRLQKMYTATTFSCIADNEETVNELSVNARKHGIETRVWLDLNVGMNRTGISPGEKALRLWNRVSDSPMLLAGGLHVYDGHIHDPDIATRQNKCDAAYEEVTELISKLLSEGYAEPSVVAGGTPSFPVHARRTPVELSPGTLLLWDFKSASSFADMDFDFAAVLLTRIISKPARDLLCIDLGHKALASEMVTPRVYLYGINSYTTVNHSEEHMVVRTKDAIHFKAGDAIYGIPFHICPTVDRYDYVNVVNNGVVTGQWSVDARRRKINI